MEELKPCPFCGGKAEIHGGRECYWIYCTGCKCSTTIQKTEEEAVKDWNRRAE